MPKIEVYEESLLGYCGEKLGRDALTHLLDVAKGELDDVDEDAGLLKIELNDTNRPDLWSTAGLGRQLRIYRTSEVPAYDFFSLPDAPKESKERVVEVDPALRDIRPYVTAFAVTGKPVDEPTLLDLIQTQEKLCWNYGQKRKSIAMGVYRSDLITWPVKYVAADPDKTRFVPLQMQRELSLRQILTDHPKGQEFGEIVSGFKRFPFLTDATGEVLSFPPVINSNRLGAVEVGDRNLFIELTGTELSSLLLTVSIVACDLADAGFGILPVKTIYPYDTPFGREVTAPYYFQSGVSVNLRDVNKMLGEKLTLQEASSCARRMGLENTVSGDNISVKVPPYRNDFLHSVDVIEDIMIGRGTETFDPVLPTEFTPGRLTAEELFCRKVKEIMMGLGYQEMIYNYLGSRRDFVERMCVTDDVMVQILNPMSENYAFVRNSILPCLLGSEAVSSHAVYPHMIFEIGKVAYLDPSDNQGSVTRNYLGFLLADRNSGYNEVSAHMTAVFYYLSKDYALNETEDPRFIPGRCAAIRYRDQTIGRLGEIHPSVLENWGVQMPCTACEIDLDSLAL